MTDQKTTIAGIIGLAGTIMAGVGALFAHKAWGQTLIAIGVALKGADSVGNMYSKDAK
jgi:hypothetical protein